MKKVTGTMLAWGVPSQIMTLPSIRKERFCPDAPSLRSGEQGHGMVLNKLTQHTVPQYKSISRLWILRLTSSTKFLFAIPSIYITPHLELLVFPTGGFPL